MYIPFYDKKFRVFYIDGICDFVGKAIEKVNVNRLYLIRSHYSYFRSYRMIDLKELRQQIKAEANQERTTDLLTFIGYEVNRAYKFKLRADENSASASIRSDGLITDFGSGWSGDIVALLHEHQGKTLKEASIWTADCLGLRYE